MLARWLGQLKRRWWLGLLLALVGASGGLIYAFAQPARFEAYTTSVFKMGDMFKLGRGAMPALDMLTRTRDIRNSVVRVASSRQTAIDAANEMQVAPERVAVRANMIGNSTLLAITVQSGDPSAATKVANAVAARAANYVRDAFKVYELVQLDAPFATPVSPNWLAPLVSCAVGGMALGLCLAVLLDGDPALAKKVRER